MPFLQVLGAIDPPPSRAGTEKGSPWGTHSPAARNVSRGHGPACDLGRGDTVQPVTSALAAPEAEKSCAGEQSTFCRVPSAPRTLTLSPRITSPEPGVVAAVVVGPAFSRPCFPRRKPSKDGEAQLRARTARPIPSPWGGGVSG